MGTIPSLPPPLKANWIIIATLYASLAVLAILYTYLKKRYFIRPLESINDAIRLISKGALHTRIPKKITDNHSQIARLAKHFNKVIGRIEENQIDQRQFLANISHEFKAPLSRQRIALDLIPQALENNHQSKILALLKRAQLENERLNLLIIETMDCLHRSGEAEYQLQEFSLSQLLEKIVQNARFEFSQSRKQLVAEIEPDKLYLGDPHHLESAFENIIRNALFHTPENSAVSVHLKMHSQDLRITVIDNGPGVPEFQLPLLTKPFFRGERSHQAPYTGYGLGLSIAEMAIKRHGGTLQFYNHAEKGLAAVITLPLN